jgi:hypothetical protein
MGDSLIKYLSQSGLEALIRFLESCRWVVGPNPSPRSEYALFNCLPTQYTPMIYERNS